MTTAANRTETSGYVLVSTESVLTVYITSNVNSFRSEKKFAKSLTIADLKSKLELITGASSLTMQISVFDKKDKLVCELNNMDNKLLGSFPIDSFMRLHVTDVAKQKGEFEDVSKVQKFELTKDEYAKREDTVQAYLKRNNLGKYDEAEMARLEAERLEQERQESNLANEKGIVVDARCEVRVPGTMNRRGRIAYVGKVHFQTGLWVGVEYDEPVGKNDGSVKDQRYFECKAKYGGFVKVANVEAGDFPEEILEEDDDEM